MKDKYKKFDRNPKLTTTQYHIDKDYLDELVNEYYDSGVMSEDLGTIILNLIEQVKAHMWKSIKHKTTLEIEEAEGKALDQITKSLISKQIQPEKGRAYSYMWQIVITRFLNSFCKSQTDQRRFANYIKNTFETNKTIEEIIDDLNFSQSEEEED